MLVEGQENQANESQVELSEVHGEAPETSGETPEAAETPTPGGEAAPQAYTPNYSFKVLEDQSEFEDWAKPYIKDEETEKKFRDLYERAHGIEHVKADRQTLREENVSIKQEVGQYRTVLGKINEMKQSGDWDSYFEALDVPKEVILKQAQKLIHLHQDPQAAARYEQERQQHWQMHQQQESQSALQQQLSEMRSQQVDMAITYGPQASFVNEFDRRVGKQGAFKDEVFKAGVYHFQTTGQDLPVQDAINQVLSLAGYQPNNPQPMAFSQPNQAGNPYAPGQGQFMQPNAPGQASPPQQPGAQARPPVLPNISGTGGSPVKAVPKSIDDLRRRRESMG